MYIISVSEMRRLERAAMANGVAGSELMECAGANAALEILRIASRFPARHRRRFVILAGKGNNGGDAWVVARCLHKAGEQVLLVSVCHTDQLGEDARWHAEQLPPDCPWEICDSAIPEHAFHEGDVIIDGLLGTGVSGAPRSIYKELIDAVNRLSCPVLALDVPSGLDADTGEGAEACRADWTLTMGYPKQGLFTGDGFRLSGTIRVIDIGLPGDVAATVQGDVQAFTREEACRLLRRRSPEGHKNTFGHLVCFCNSRDYCGAGYLCATAAMRAGAGLVTLVTPEGSQRREGPAALIQRRLGHAADAAFGDGMAAELPSLLAGKSAVVFGPGVSLDASGAFLSRLLETPLPMVIDADGLKMLAQFPKTLRRNVVLTPHPGEMRQLLDGYGLASLQQASRISQAQALADAADCIIVLKGRFTVVAAPGDSASLNLSGDASLATAGSGDVLAGIIGAFVAEGMAPADAARLGVFVHGLAAEMRHSSSRALIADDLPELVGDAFLELMPY